MWQALKVRSETGLPVIPPKSNPAADERVIGKVQPLRSASLLAYYPLSMKYKQIFKTTSGNVIGVIEEPMILDPDVPLDKQRRVKIGVVDPSRKLSRTDSKRVINRLREFVEESDGHAST